MNFSEFNENLHLDFKEDITFRIWKLHNKISEMQKKFFIEPMDFYTKNAIEVEIHVYIDEIFKNYRDKPTVTVGFEGHTVIFQLDERHSRIFNENINSLKEKHPECFI